MKFKVMIKYLLQQPVGEKAVVQILQSINKQGLRRAAHLEPLWHYAKRQLGPDLNPKILFQGSRNVYGMLNYFRASRVLGCQGNMQIQVQTVRQGRQKWHFLKDNLCPKKFNKHMQNVVFFPQHLPQYTVPSWSTSMLEAIVQI